mmetsp:Transcript_34322/g.77852  ORF Transcript_34322/g.77852 Transcript_34322/m.77852 type:complete len:149 (-) Transcript_34322:89-535(-)
MLTPPGTMRNPLKKLAISVSEAEYGSPRILMTIAPPLAPPSAPLLPPDACPPLLAQTALLAAVAPPAPFPTGAGAGAGAGAAPQSNLEQQEAKAASLVGHPQAARRQMSCARGVTELRACSNAAPCVDQLESPAHCMFHVDRLRRCVV